MTDSDLIQTWTYTERMRACEIGGAVDLRTVERLDFRNRTVTTHTTGCRDGERVDERSEFRIDPDVTPKAAAVYRSRRGYTRVS